MEHRLPVEHRPLVEHRLPVERRPLVEHRPLVERRPMFQAVSHHRRHPYLESAARLRPDRFPERREPRAGQEPTPDQSVRVFERETICTCLLYTSPSPRDS